MASERGCVCGGTGPCQCNCSKPLTQTVGFGTPVEGYYNQPGDYYYPSQPSLPSIPSWPYPIEGPNWQPMPHVNPMPFQPLQPMVLPQAGWLCQRCGRSYGPQHIQCFPCNNEISEQQKKEKQQLNG